MTPVKEITGKYKGDGYGFLNVFADNTLYTIATRGADWGFVPVGSTMANGFYLTQELYDIWESECEHTGTFTLYE